MEIEASTTIIVGERCYAMFDDGDYVRIPPNTINPEDDPLIFGSFDEVVEFMEFMIIE